METRTVLFVDDESKVLASLKRGLLDEPYEKLFATSGKEAIELLKQNEVHVIVTDMKMPEMSGLELLRTVKQEYPHIVRVVLSGYTQITTLLTAINQGEIFKFITKPWKLEEEFKGVVREALERYNLQKQQLASEAQLTAAQSSDTSEKMQEEGRTQT